MLYTLKGDRQGCPLSPFSFFLAAEILANKIRQSQTVRGIPNFSSEIVLSQFADNRNLFCADLTSQVNAL